MTLCNRQLIAFWESRNSPGTGLEASGESTTDSVGVLARVDSTSPGEAIGGNPSLVRQGVATAEPAGSKAKPSDSWSDDLVSLGALRRHVVAHPPPHGKL